MRFLALALLSLFSVVACTGTASDANPDKLNFVVVLVDDLGRQDVGIYGSSLYETPNIDALAKSGMRFDNAYVAHPRCLPSRLAMMSGRYPVSYGIPGFQDKMASKHALPLSTTTFAEVLKGAGYQTGYIGKWHLGKKGGEPNFQGFDTSIMAGHAGAPPSYFFPYEKNSKGKTKKDFVSYSAGDKDEYLTDRLTDEALNFIEQKKDKPFMLVLAHYAVHTPIEAPASLVDKYSHKLKTSSIKAGGKGRDKDIVEDSTGEFKTVQNHPVYAAMVDSVDQNLGRIIDKLDALDLSENTVVIITSDHGGLSSRTRNGSRELATSNLPYRHGKGWLYDGGIRVPLIVKWPGKIAAGSVSSVQVTGTDHYPTFLDLAGLPLQPKHHRDGESYGPALEGKDYQRPPMFWHSSLGRPSQTGDTRSSAVIDGDWKFIQWYSLKNNAVERIELFNITKDPAEQQNLAERELEKKQQLETMLNNWKLSVNARLGKFK